MSKAQVELIYRQESRRVFATLVRLLGDFQQAEEALQDAFLAALKQWPDQGVPANPRAWLVSAGRFKAIDRLRRDARFDLGLDERADQLEGNSPDPADWDDDDIEDDRLRLVFTCCHPALAQDARVALTLREVCGLTTEEIARAFLISPSTLAQRIVRAKTKIRDAGIPYEVPAGPALAERLEAVLQVVYLLFNEGYSPAAGDSAVRGDLSAEAIRLGEWLVTLLPEAETRGLLALMLLQESRREARSDAQGELILLSDQDRRRWNRQFIERGCALAAEALQTPGFGVYSLQAAIAAVHAEAASEADTDWRQIVGLYDVLLRLSPTPVVALNRAVALGMAQGPAAGLAAVDALLDAGQLLDYHLAHAARADFLRRLQRVDDAISAYIQALNLARQGPEQRFLQRRIDQLRAGCGK
ncbi:RNA polymerase sigma factor [Spongiibacter taiwanensis]|uniref:RNA polymerase sigma factor n=1 Tax=Spongiibacter taiwanensis TaxID=1748242 RepID=UPI0020357638|nr:RNA polymerase sigma factor [Spongiibacter taiwanensis]USA41709.1 RNA polymerase sigma factor [Spongiibacter taiwanensis]